MPALTRRRDPDVRHECWLVYYGDVHVGTIAVRAGIPHDEDPWGWTCGFYPGSEPGEYLSGTVADFDQARAHFETAWRLFSAKRTDADFQAWRDQRDWTARKYALWDAGERLPSARRRRRKAGADNLMIPSCSRTAGSWLRSRMPATISRSAAAGMAGCDGSAHPCRRERRAYDVRAD
jgi:hypothetical protein